MLKREKSSGGYQIILFDVYDFELNRDYDRPFWDSVNNAAWVLQSIGGISNYYLIVPINISKEEADKIKDAKK